MNYQEIINDDHLRLTTPMSYSDGNNYKLPNMLIFDCKIYRSTNLSYLMWLIASKKDEVLSDVFDKYYSNVDKYSEEDLKNDKFIQEIINMRSSDGWSVLHFIVGYGFIDITTAINMVHILVKGGMDINVRGQFGLAPIHLSAMDKSDYMEYTLTELGADLEIKDNNGKTPLYYNDTNAPYLTNFTLRDNILKNKNKKIEKMEEEIKKLREENERLKLELSLVPEVGHLFLEARDHFEENKNMLKND